MRQSYRLYQNLGVEIRTELYAGLKIYALQEGKRMSTVKKELTEGVEKAVMEFLESKNIDIEKTRPHGE